MKRRTNQPIRGLRCSFCQSKESPRYAKTEALQVFVTERGRVVGRDRTGVCAKHQRQLTREIERARYLALLPFVTKV